MANNIHSADATRISRLPWQDAGVYLLSGDAARSGLILAREIASSVRGARIVLTGDASASEQLEQELQALRHASPEAELEYRAIDAADEAAVRECVQQIVSHYGQLNGVAHCVGAIEGGRLAQESDAELRRMLAVTMRGALNLDAATRDLPLQWMAFLAPVSDYAPANGFMDGYAAYRNELEKRGKRSGQTLSSNWRAPNESALDALYRAWRGDETAKQGESRPAEDSQDDGLLEKVRAALTQAISSQQKLKEQQIDADASLGELGFDSLGLTAFANGLNQAYGLTLRATVFFEYPTVRQLSEHLMQRYADVLRKKLAGRASRVERAQVERARIESTRVDSSHVRAPRARSEGAQQIERDSHAHPRLNDGTLRTTEGIAIIGMSGTFPGAADVGTFWDVLEQGRDCITEIPADRWDWRAIYGDPHAAPGKTKVKWGGFIDGVYDFDSLFFSISPMEAQMMDPQQRLLLSHGWNAIEEAGYSAQSLSGSRTGVFVGMGASGYSERLSRSGSDEYSLPMYPGSMGPNRLSYWLNLHGPSEPVETACSSSLVALHRAVRSIQSGDCEMALVGGVNTLLSPTAHIKFSQAGMLAEDGRCKTFSKDANGYARGEGVGILLLKKLDAARRDGDHIHGVIRATAENHGGRASSLTAPNPKAQAELLKAAYREAGIDPGSVGYIETHGTGTVLGDPIEINGLKSAFDGLSELRQQPQSPYHCGLGSVKTNVGHLELAAGVAGVIKVLLQMKHRVLVPSLHCKEINPSVDLQDTPFYVVTQRRNWEAPRDSHGVELPRRAGVSSFSIGGANAHVVLEEYRPEPSRKSSGDPEHPALVVLSARTDEALRERVRQLLAHIDAGAVSDDELGDLAYTLQVGREPMEHRLAVTAWTMQELKQKLAAYTEGTADAAEIDECYRGEVKQNRELLSGLNADESTRGLIRGWLEKGKYGHLLQLWSKGLMVAWQNLYVEGGIYGSARPRRLSLPGYPFAKIKCVIEPRAQVEKAAHEHAGGDAVDDASSDSITLPVSTPPTAPLLYAEEWQASVLPTPRVPVLPRKIVVILSDPARQQELLATLPGQAKVTFLAEPVHAYAESLSRICAEHGEIDAVWYLRAVEDRTLVSDHSSIIELIQALATAGVKNTKVWLCGEYASALERAHVESWVGYARSIVRILPEMRLAVIQSSAEGQIALWARRLWDELGASDVTSALYEDGKRHVLAVRPVQSAAAPTLPAFRENGTYLITGGLGGLGYALAEYLARNFSARLVLIGRTALDATREARLHALQNLGGDAVYEPADVGNPEQMSAALERARQRFGNLHGVVHAAGVSPGRTTVLDRSADEICAVLAPKISGTEVLSELLKDQELDFLCHFSSVSAVLGDFGSCDYAVGNRFELAHARYTGRALAVCWSLWADGGMEIGKQAQQLYLRSSGQRALELTEGLQLLEQLIARHRSDGTSHAIVVAGERSKVNRLLGVPEVSVPSLRRGMTVSENVVQELQQLASELLKLPRDQIALDTNLAEYGFDSILLAKFARTMSAHFGVEILPSVFFSHTSLQKLGLHLEREYRQQIGQRYVTQQPRASSEVRVPSVVDNRPKAQPRAAADPAEPIAIIGMSGRFPQARTVDELWQILSEGREAVQEIPPERYDWRDYYQAPNEDGSAVAGKSCSKWLGALPGVDEFDPLFFEIPPKEARLMDPRQRLLLQEAYRALEDAGYASAHLDAQKIAVFVGVEQGEYQKLLGREASLTGNHDGVLAARLSYFLNLHGPVIALNTTCSSGLVAVHQACASLRTGECDTAIAAAANLLLRPQSYVALSAAGMLSSRGRCRAFDRSADGMVPGEAVAAVVLKRLSQAESDGDLIYALIRGSGINYDGHTNGLTAPNGAAQAALIEATYERAGVRAEQIEYIVTHGTGTRLGDPVEINALSDAFRRSMKREPDESFCALTSTKTNFGHTFAASGVVSLISLVQSLRHQLIPASLHCEELSDYIDWRRSPFYVNRANRAWLSDKKRLGAVSAFGVSGTNAHVVVESYEDPSISSHTSSPGYLLTLSAKTESALTRRIEDMLTLLREPGRTWDGDTLASLSYTLLVHRTHFAHRCAIVVEDERQAVELLEKARAGTKAPQLFVGRAPPAFIGQPAIQQYAAELIAKLPQQLTDPRGYHQSLAALADLQCQGYALDWKPLFGAQAPKRLRLPAYPFDRDRYWPEVVNADAAGASVAALHPLLHVNTSDLGEQRFTSTFTGEEFFFADHRVKGRRVLPGVCHLEMARAALQTSLQTELAAGECVELRDVVWLQPLVAEGPLAVHIRLATLESDEVEFEIYTRSIAGEEVVHAQGRAALVTAAPAERSDLQTLRSQCDQSVDVARCYEAFSRMGLDYGEGHRGLKRVQLGRDEQGRVVLLARVDVPDSTKPGSDRYGLHPSVMDSALQANVALALTNDEMRGEGASRPALPFAVERVRIRNRTPEVCWAVSRLRSGTGSLRKLDIELCDESGQVCVELQGFTSRALDEKQVDADVAAPVELLAPKWREKPLAHDPVGFKGGERWVVLDAALQDRVGELSRLLPSVQVTAASNDELGEQIFGYVQKALQGKPKDTVLLQVVVAEERASLGGALSGLLKTARQENPKFIGQVIVLPGASTTAEILRAAEQNANEAGRADTHARYRSGVREAPTIEPLEHNDSTTTSPWKDGGVYLITGGAGGLGLIVADEIARACRRVKLVLSGRGELDARRREQLEALRGKSADAQIDYQVMDVADADAVASGIQQIVARHGTLCGIVHAAGVIRDNFILKKSLEEFRAVAAAKVQGTLNLDRATESLQLDSFILFSSMTGAVGNVGQSDYAFANAFMDSFAHERQQLVEQGRRHGRTLSINWPLWAEGGMGAAGMVTMQTADGIESLYRAWHSGEARVLVMVRSAQPAVMTEDATRQAEPDLDVPMPEGKPEQLREKTVQYLKRVLSRALQIPVERVESDAALERYGIDSILALRLVKELEVPLGALPKTLLFEYQSLDALAGYLLDQHREALQAHLAGSAKGVSAPQARSPRATTVVATVSAAPTGRMRRRARPAGATPEREQREAREARDAQSDAGAMPIAIIGLSGRYPQARDLNEFWENLITGRDCITEIPRHRWDSDAYFDARKGERGKSYSKWGGFISGEAEFDSLFFNISPREAQFMDPQERLFLQCAYQTLEDAGYTRQSLSSQAGSVSGDVGVYVGVMYEEYLLYGAQAQALGHPFAIGGNPASIANRVSYFCNFHGPSLAVNTMCSSSLTAIHLACESLRTGSCAMALAGGVNLSLHPNKYLTLSQGQFASSTGRCESFGRGGDGYVPGEGVGAVLLKPLAAAIADGDHIHGVIRGTSINHGGKTNGFTVPNPQAQGAVIAQALKQAGVDARQVSYVEAHGTGTSLGDPIEIAGLTQAFRQHTQESQYCAIGSAKSNIGHLESAAGIAGLTKVLLQMKHEKLVPSLHSEELNPHIDFEHSPFRVQRELAEWRRPVLHVGQGEGPRIAGLSSFGAGGANAHVIVQEYVAAADARSEWIDADHPALIVLSAKSAERLKEQVQRLAQHLEREAVTQSALGDLAYTLQVGREAMEHRLALTARTVTELKEKLAACMEGKAERGEIEECYYGEVRQNREVLSGLNADEETRGFIDTWLRNGKYGRLLQLWSKGLSVSWSSLYADGAAYGGTRPQRRSLPVYPFARERFWLPEQLTSVRPVEVVAPQPALPSAPADAGTQGDLSGALRMVPVWEPVPVKASRVNLVPRGAVICIGGSAAQRAAIGNHFPTAVYLPDEPDASIAARVALFERYAPVDTVICLFDAFSTDSMRAEELITGQRTGVINCFRTVKALLQLGYRNRKLNFYALTVAAHAIDRTERIGPAHAGVDGLVGALSKECPQWNVVSADLPSQDELPAPELFSLPKSQRAHLWVYRNRQWYQHSLITVSTEETGKTAWRRGGVYVVIGGAGQVGEACSEHLIREYGAQVIWIGRRAMDDTIREKVRRLGALGPAPLYISADATDRNAMESARAQIKATYREIHGLVHAAMVFGVRPLERMEESEFESALYAKVSTCVRMAQVFAADALDFVVFFSSLIAFIKNAGQAHYAAGCTFSDAFAHQLRSELAYPVKVMNWGFWAIGGDKRLGDVGIAPIEPHEGMRALDELLNGRLEQTALMCTTRAIPIEGLTGAEVVCASSQTAPAVSASALLMTRLGD